MIFPNGFLIKQNMRNDTFNVWSIVEQKDGKIYAHLVGTDMYPVNRNDPMAKGVFTVNTILSWNVTVYNEKGKA